MGKPRKLWSQLSESTRKRYAKAGVIARQYNSGNIQPEQKAKAQGRKAAAEPRKPKRPSGHVILTKARGKTKPFSQLSPERQRADIRRVMGDTGVSEKEARRLLISAHRRGEILRTSKMIGPVRASEDVGHTATVNRVRAFQRLSPAKRSELARAWANRRYGNVLYFDIEGLEIPDWPYEELDAEAWVMYQEGQAA
jgi:hypothetical protein